MREDIAFDNRTKPCKISQNRGPDTMSNNGNPPKLKSSSSWSSQIMKSFVSDKKSKPHAMVPNVKPPPTCSEDYNKKNQYLMYHPRVKRSLIIEFPCECQRVRSTPSTDFFMELDHLRSLLRESMDREQVLQSELQKCKSDPRIHLIERDLNIKNLEIERLNTRLGDLEAEKASLSVQLASLSSILESHENAKPSEIKPSFYRNLELEILELRRMNKEMQLQKRNLALRLASTESQVAFLAKSDIVAKAQAEASVLRVTNEDLCKQVEGLQMRRLTEVEELAYLRWVNSCLRHELCNSDFTFRTTKDGTDLNNVDGSCDPCKEVPMDFFQWCSQGNDKDWIELKEGRSSQRRHSISGLNGYLQKLNVVNTRRQSDGFIYHKGIEESTTIGKESEQLIAQKYNVDDVESPNFPIRIDSVKTGVMDVEKRALRVPTPPPRPSIAIPKLKNIDETGPNLPPPPPPPPPLPKFSAKNSGIMKRAPQVAELYHSLMKRDSRKDNGGGGACDTPDIANARSSMIGEIENRSSYLLAIKADVETQGEFVKALIKEVNNAVFVDIEDVVAFVRWLDDELRFLVDERAVLKHFDWPEKKADILREAAFGYLDLKKLESEATCYEDDPRLPCEIALKKMVSLTEKIEVSAYNLLRTRDSVMRNYKDFQIPTDWMLDTGLISKIKFAAVKLARKYLKRVAAELQAMGASEKGPALDYMLLQGVRFAFKIHQFAGGFDAETMHAFEELRNLDLVGSKI